VCGGGLAVLGTLASLDWFRCIQCGIDVSRNHPRPEGDGEAASEADLFGEPIAVYTRQEAIEDGVLVDVTAWASTGPDGMLAGFTAPVAITRALWAVIDVDAQGASDEVRWRVRVRQRGESTRGRAHDVLWLARVSAGRHPDADRVRFPVLMTVEGHAGRAVRKRLIVEARIDGDGVTIGLPEDF
jgi:hypothetical protein